MQVLPQQSVRVATGIGLAGVYDIETHYQYEFGRGVAELSTMKRAMGGRHRFPSQSPALILSSACGHKAQVKLPGLAESPAGSRYAGQTIYNLIINYRCYSLLGSVLRLVAVKNHCFLRILIEWCPCVPKWYATHHKCTGSPPASCFGAYVCIAAM